MSARSIRSRADNIKQRQKIAYPKPVVTRWFDVERSETICYYCKFKASYKFVRCPNCERNQETKE